VTRVADDPTIRGSAMTSVSRLRGLGLRVWRAKHAISLAGPAAARNLLTRCIMVVCTGVALLGGTVSCVPVPLELDEPDAAPNSPPMLLSVTDVNGNELPSLQTIAIGGGGLTQMSFTVADNDSADFVYVNYYMDYNRDLVGGVPVPTPKVGGCVASQSLSGAERNVDCTVTPACIQFAGDGQVHFLEAIVADRALDDADVSFRGLVGGGLSSIGRWWQVTCQ
jgi:hypothetical protein